ncbi:MAG: hypothetical protein M3347_12490, partial [Armatimonadota bacterium]|nr:hypothetical protein [Armatimonadota bacterium]
PGVTQIASSHQGTLLYTMQPELNETITTQAENKPQGDEADAMFTLQRMLRPSIYEVPAAGGEPKKLIQDGYSPMPSPDDAWIAFFGWPDAAQEVAEARATHRTPEPAAEPRLYLYNRATKKRILIHSQTFDFLRWTPDNRHLIMIETQYEKDIADKGQGKAHIKVVDITKRGVGDVENTRNIKDIARLQAQDFKPISRIKTAPQFQPLGVSKDGSYLFVKVSENIGIDHPFYREIKSLQAVNLNDGTISLVARIDNKWGSVLGWDWYDESARINRDQ